MDHDSIPSECFEQYCEKDPEGGAAVELYRELFFDSFMDVLGHYIDWRKSGANPNRFLSNMLKRWGIREWIKNYPPAVVKRMVERAGTELVINDDATIASAVAHLVVDNKIPVSVRKKAVLCIDRQRSDVVIAYRGYSDPERAQSVFDGLRALVLRS